MCSFVQNHDSLTTNPFHRNCTCSLIEFHICKNVDRISYRLSCRTVLLSIMYSQKRFSQASLQIPTKYFKSWIIMLCLELWYSVEKYSWQHRDQHISKRNYEITVVEEIHISRYIPTSLLGTGKPLAFFIMNLCFIWSVHLYRISWN